MRTVYIDVLITVNLFIDFFLILCVKLLLHLRAGLLRMILGAAAGGLLSLTALLPALPFLLNLAADAALSAPIVLIAFGRCKWQTFIRRVGVFFLCSFVFCGVMVALYTALHPKGMAIYNNVVYFNISPLLLIMLTLACYGVIKLFDRFSKSEVTKRVCDIKVYGRNGSTSFAALADTGCQVREPFSGYYVIIAEKELLKELILQQQGFRVIPYHTLSGSGIVRGYLPQKVLIDGSEAAQPLYIGICENVLKGNVRAIIPYELISV